MSRPVVVAYVVRSGVTALNVVTAALDADPRTRDVEVRFAASRDALCDGLREVAARGDRPVALWSFYSTDLDATAADLAAVREATAGLPTLHVAGGVHATAEPRGTLALGFDLVALGEGEATIGELLARLLDGRDARGLRGLAYLDEGGSFVTHGPGERRPLDDFPACNLKHCRWNALEITRGCVYACSFCATPFLTKARFRHRSVDDVRMHLRAMMQAGGIRFVRFVTPTALSYGSEDTSVRLDRVEALLAGVREEVGPTVKVYFGTFPSEVRPEHVTREALSLIRRYCDNDNLILGGQSGAEAVLERTHRGHRVQDVERAVALTVEAGLVPNVDFLFGTPGETDAERSTSLAFAERLVRMGARIHNHAFMPLPGTPLAGDAPAPLDAGTVLAMQRLESAGALYGQWQRQLVAAERLAQRPRGKGLR